MYEVHTVIDTQNNTRHSKWYERLGDAKRNATSSNYYQKGRFQARTFVAIPEKEYETKEVVIPGLDDIEFVEANTSVLADGSTYVEITLANKHGEEFKLKGGYDAN